MNAIGIIGIIIAIGVVSMFEICAIIGAISKMVDQKMKTKSEIELRTFQVEMQYMEKTIDKILNGIQQCFGGNSKS